MLDPNEVLETQLLLLTKSQAYLRRMKIRNVTARRFEDTWHHKPIVAHWASTIGLWGGVGCNEDILLRTKANYNTFKTFRARNGLFSRTSAAPPRSQWELAISAYIKWKTGDGNPEKAPQVAALFGILPIEFRIYVDRVQLILDEYKLLPGDILEEVGYNMVRDTWPKHQETIDDFVMSAYHQTAHG